MNRLSYRPDVDGLRAVAVLGVLFFHAGLGCQGGFVGVDIFFVISGFLITSLILRDLREGTFSFVDFWARRIRRIVPALAVMTLAVIVVGYFGMFPDYYEKLGQQVIALVLCVSNMKFWRENGYFDTASDEKPLLHTWSLSVEEQFYFIIPITLFLVFRFKRERLALPLIVLTCVASFAASVYASTNDPSANFYLLPTRAWELGVGSLLAFAGPIRSAKLQQGASFLGLALIIGCYFLFPEDASFPGASALPPVIGAALIIWSGIGQSKLPAISRLLTLKPIVGIGLISYSLYLWHWPIFAFQKHLSYSSESQTIQIILLLISLVPAWLSWKFVETPFRKTLVFYTQRGIVQFAGATAMLLVSFGGLAWQTAGYFWRFDANEMSYIRTARETIGLKILDDLNLNLKEVGTKRIGNRKDIDFALWGDSHAMSLSHTFDLQAEKLGLGGISLLHSGWPPLINVERNDRGVLPSDSIALTLTKLKPKVVFMVMRGVAYTKGKSDFEVKVKKTETRFGSLIKHKSLKSFDKENAFRSYETSLAETITELTTSGAKVFLIQDWPELPFSITNIVEWKTKLLLRQKHETDPSKFIVTREDYLERQGTITQISKDVASKIPNAHFLTTDSVIFRDGKDFKPFNDDGVFYYDDDHLNDFGANHLLGDLIEKWLQDEVQNK